MKIYLFNKILPKEDEAALIARARTLGLDGYHLCVRPGYITNAENVEKRLPEVTATLRGAGVDVPMVTSRGDMIMPEDPDVRPLLRAMDRADIRLLKVGYFRLPRTPRFEYEVEISRARAVLKRWQDLAREYQVKICCHTHSSCGDYFLSSNAAGVMNLVRDFDPNLIGVYLDSAHLALEGEPFDLAVNITRPYLAAVALKDARWFRPLPGQKPEISWARAGEGTVDWGMVGRVLADEAFAGPVSIHAEYESPDVATGIALLVPEVAFIRRQMDQAGSSR